MPIIQFHTPSGIVTIDSDTVTDEVLAELGVTRETLAELIPRDILAEIDGMKGKMVVSEPPVGMTKIKNLYKDPETDEMVGEDESE